MEFGKSSWRSFEHGIEKEWLLTNGIGGFSSSTIIGANTRRYHGLLIASLKPPVRRHLILSKIDESIIINNQSHNLYSNRTPDHTMKGYLHLQRVAFDPLPTFTYNVEDTFIEKKVSMVYGRNEVVIVYRVINGERPTRLKLTPLVNFRDYHGNSNRAYMSFTTTHEEKEVFVNPYNSDINISISCSQGLFIREENCYFLNMDYPVERERGLFSTEDHYIPGYFEIDIKPGENKLITIIATIEDEVGNKDGLSLIEQEKNRISQLQDIAGYSDTFAKALVAAADNFIVYRKSTDAKTVIAGYPWFTDWGRDTMIALPGLTLVTKRYGDAKEILSTFSRYVKDGLIPNMFPDEGQEPLYNSVDAALWYFEAANKYLEYTGEYDYFKENIYGALKEIVNFFIKGTKFNIKMNEDFLVSAGDRGTQLTWMDAKVGDWVVTPRQGKAVEINALWFNALKIMEQLADRYDEDSFFYCDLSEKVKASFRNTFWNKDSQCLYDVINVKIKDAKVRPNQILAISLSFPVIEGKMAKKVIESVWSKLYTSYGLRTLSQDSNEYSGIYTGDQLQRDGAYHQGTVWPWLIGHFITAYMKVYGYTEENRKKARLFINPFRDHLNDSCIGSISEIFDGDEPLIPRGCFAQAWSVAEVLRAYIEDVGAR